MMNKANSSSWRG